MKTGHKNIDDRKLIDRLSPDLDMGACEGFWGTTFEFQSEFFETDFLPSFLSLGSWDNRHWTTRISMERELAQMSSASVLMDATRYPGRPRSLRVEIFPSRGVHNNRVHAKVLLIVYERGVRLIVGSANLTEPGYRQNIEVSACLSASVSDGKHKDLILEAIQNGHDLLSPWWTPGVALISQMAVERLNRIIAKRHPPEWFAWSGGTDSLVQQFINKWPEEERIEKAHIVSPFWSEEEGNGPVSQFIKMLRASAPTNPDIEVHLYTSPTQTTDENFVPTLPLSYGTFDFNKINVKCYAHAVSPKVLFEEVLRSDFTGTRQLHAKVVILEGERFSLAYLGSANFTRNGWGFLPRPENANIEAGIILLREKDADNSLLTLLPETIGDTVELTGKEVPFQVSSIEPDGENLWPYFLSDVRLIPNTANNRELDIMVRIKTEMVDGGWQIQFEKESPHEENIIFKYDTNERRKDNYHKLLSAEQLHKLLTSQEVFVSWWACPEAKPYPLNVSLAARDELPVTPDSAKPGEKLLLAYYQGRIAYEELFPPDDIEQNEQRTIIFDNEPSGVDTSGILSYQIREFVEALDGISSDLKQASGSERSMRFALLGPVSPLELAKIVYDSVIKDGRSPTAAGFQLVEILKCVQDIQKLPGNSNWEKHRIKAQVEIEVLLNELVAKFPKQLGKRTAFNKYRTSLVPILHKEGNK